MHSSSLRALLLALVMVLQTVAGNVGMARAMTDAAGLALTTHCDKTGDTPSDNAAGGNQSHHRHCDSCCLCGEPPGVSLTESVPALMTRRAIRVAALVPSETSGAPARLAQAQQARGPPAASERA